MNWNRTLLTKLFFGFVNLKLLKFIILIMKEYKWKMCLNVLKYRFAYLTNKINKSFPWFWNTLFRPVSELELSDSSALSISSICHLKKLICDTWVLLLNLNDSTDLKLSKNVLRHIIFCQGVNNKILVSCRSFTWPILGTFFLIKIITWFFFLEKDSFLSRPISLSFVSMTTIVLLCSHSILQKSSTVSLSGPCVAIYAFLYLYPSMKLALM